jgi:hypothetical protein
MLPDTFEMHCCTSYCWQQGVLRTSQPCPLISNAGRVLASADCCRLLVLLPPAERAPSAVCWSRVLLLLSVCETDLLRAGSFPAADVAAATVVAEGLLDAAFSRRWCAANWPLTGGAGHRALLTNLQKEHMVGASSRKPISVVCS